LHDICSVERPVKRKTVDAVEHRMFARGIAKFLDVSVWMADSFQGFY
jgi:hypothetical protein